MRLLRFARRSPAVFISYRRDDSSGYAGRLHDALRQEFGTDRVRMDVDDFQAGHEFALEAKRMIAESNVVLVLIGKRWAEGTNAGRLGDPSDLLRQEIETALEMGVRVIPVLLNGAGLPGPAVLPNSLHPLLQRNAFELTERRWDYDVRDLIQTLRRTPHRLPSRVGAGTVGVRAGRNHWKAGVLAAAMAAVLIAGSVYGWTRWRGDERDRRVDASAPAHPGVFGIDHDRFFNAYTREFGPLTAEARSGLDGLLYLVDADTALADIRRAAYVLATIKHETNDTWLPYAEPDRGSGRAYGNPVVVTDSAGRRYRNVYYGRGYVLLTWEYNYRTMGQRIRQPRLLYEPDLALEPIVAYAVLSLSLREGLLTSTPLRRYINPTRCDYFNARRTVNGTDQAERIAAYAVTLEKILRESTPPPEPGLIVITPSLYLRAEPHTSANPIGEPLPRGTVVRALEDRGSWKRVTGPGTERGGWVPVSFLRPATSAELQGPACAPPAAADSWAAANQASPTT
ncbi:MAG TPA: TIR domain-containing protein [Longimicrobium sp.]|nr:TIR domain-containing protein [Longimicrobium sp.]